MPAIFVAGNYVDIHDNHNCNIYATEPPSVSPEIIVPPVGKESNSGNTSPAQNLTPEPISSSPSLDLFCRITRHAIDTGHAQEVEDELRSACVCAPKLVKAIRRNEALGYLDTQNLTSTELYDLLNEHFGLVFRLENFRKYRRK